jgi:hypothetical protein
MNNPLLNIADLVGPFLDETQAWAQRNFGDGRNLAWLIRAGGQFFEDPSYRKRGQVAVHFHADVDGAVYDFGPEPVNGLLTSEDYVRLPFVLNAVGAKEN